MNYETLPAIPAYALKIIQTSWDAIKTGLCSALSSGLEHA